MINIIDTAKHSELSKLALEDQFSRIYKLVHLLCPSKTCISNLIDNNYSYYMASSVGGQYESNPVL